MKAARYIKMGIVGPWEAAGQMAKRPSAAFNLAPKALMLSTELVCLTETCFECEKNISNLAPWMLQKNYLGPP